jgi:hypothetical protein
MKENERKCEARNQLTCANYANSDQDYRILDPKAAKRGGYILQIAARQPLRLPCFFFKTPLS